MCQLMYEIRIAQLWESDESLHFDKKLKMLSHMYFLFLQHKNQFLFLLWKMASLQATSL
jgi:hypothetical protein